MQVQQGQATKLQFGDIPTQRGQQAPAPPSSSVDDADERYVQQAQTAAWVDPTGTLNRATFAAYAGQVVSNPPTQAQMQALDDALKAHSQRLAALITDLRAIGVLT